MNNNKTDQFQSSNNNSQEVPKWEKPFLYKEDWLNTLSGTTKGQEGEGVGNKSKRTK